MSTLTVSQARAALPDLLTRVAAGEEVTITRHGQPVAVLVRPDALRSRRATAALAAAERLDAALAAARRTAALPGGGLLDEGITAARADELVARMRAARDADQVDAD
ncbi:MAG TPA: type II toxin-antitoxin system Phd/YefM family antitoxin [Mycobacteriales bacterium]|nr:type II toxin-antitoxin system Phd/YefM family antitoxin [Mycobacteriales bacterium]